MKTLMSVLLASLIAASIAFYFFSKPSRYQASLASATPVAAASSPAPLHLPGPASPSYPSPAPAPTPAAADPSPAAADPRISQPTAPASVSSGRAAPLPQSSSALPARTDASPAATSTPAPRTLWPPSSAWTDIEERVFLLTNVERRKAGLQPLAREDGLRASARAQSLDMLQRHFFDHVNPSGENPSDRIGRIHRTLIGTAGENLWRATGPSFRASPDLAALIVDAWMNSPHHRENILRSEFNHLGVGVVLEGDEVRATQNFSAVKAYLGTALPASLASGAPVDLSTLPQAPMYKLHPAGKPEDNGPPAKIADAHLTAPPGTYRIAFYYSEDRNRFSVYEGPQLSIR